MKDQFWKKEKKEKQANRSVAGKTSGTTNTIDEENNLIIADKQIFGRERAKTTR